MNNGFDSEALISFVFNFDKLKKTIDYLLENQNVHNIFLEKLRR